MKDKTKFLAAFIICVMGIALLATVGAPRLDKGLPWLSLSCARAASCPRYSSCADCCQNNPDHTRLYCVTVYKCCKACEYCLWDTGGDRDACRRTGDCNGTGPGEERPQPPDQVDVGQGRQGVYDPRQPDVRVDFPAGAVSQPIEVRAYPVAELPAGVPPPAGGMVGSRFLLGVWIRGQGKTVSEFSPSIVVSVPYEEGVPSPDGAPSDEERLRLSMYDPTALAWIKLCSRVDTYANRISGALLVPTPLEEGGNALLVVTVDDTPALEQAVDAQGRTTLSMPGTNFRLGVPAGAVEVGTYFEVTRLPETPGTERFKLLPTPVDIKACQAGYNTTCDQVCQLNQFPKPMQVAFEVDPDTRSRAGGRANLTIVGLRVRDGQWVDLEEYGYSVVRGDTGIAVDSGQLGTFSMAVR